jgi:hypothetical protein
MADMAERGTRSGERKWVMVAIAIIVLGIVVATLERLHYVPLLVGTAGTVLMGVGAIIAAIAASRATRNDD